MKTKLILLAALCSLAASLSAADSKRLAGPKGGRLLDTEPRKTEFFVNAERLIEITFYDADLHPVAAEGQQVTVISEPSTGKTPIELTKTANGFVSKIPLPPGEPYRVVVQVRESAGAKPKNFRLDFSHETCAECQHAEYACTCEGH